MMYKKIYFLERIISGISGENLATFPCGSVTGSEYPILVDLDNDNESEIVCSCGDSDYIPSGAMKTFQSRFTSRAPSRNIWNQYPYFVANINNDMTIPVQQTHNQVSGNLPFGADNRLNAFLKQAASFSDTEIVSPGSNIKITSISNNRNVSVSPNPATENFDISLTSFYGKTNINIYDLYGRLFFKKEIFINQNSFSEAIDSRSFPTGAYFISIKDGKTSNITRIIIE